MSPLTCCGAQARPQQELDIKELPILWGGGKRINLFFIIHPPGRSHCSRKSRRGTQHSIPASVQTKDTSFPLHANVLFLSFTDLEGLPSEFIRVLVASKRNLH